MPGIVYDIIHPVRHSQFQLDPHMKSATHDQKTDADPEKGKPATFWILPANRKGLKSLSEQTGTSVSYLINRAISRYLEDPQSLFLPQCHTNHTSKEG